MAPQRMIGRTPIRALRRAHGITLSGTRRKRVAGSLELARKYARFVPKSWKPPKFYPNARFVDFGIQRSGNLAVFYSGSAGRVTCQNTWGSTFYRYPVPVHRF